MSDTATSGVKQGFQLKSASVSMTALELYYFDDSEFEEVLRDKISQAPGFFKDIPLIISLEKYQGLDSELDFFKIIGTCRRNHIHVIGVRGGTDDQRRLARGAALALLPGNGQRDRTHEAEQADADEAVALCPPQATGLQVGKLALLGLAVGVGHLVGDVRSLSGERALAGHDCLRQCKWCHREQWLEWYVAKVRRGQP